MKIILLILSILCTNIMANSNEDILLYKVLNKDHKVTAKFLVDTLNMNGYTVSKNQDMNGPYKRQFNKTIFHSYNLITLYHPQTSTEVVPVHPSSGIFTPFSIATYQGKGDDYFYIALLTAKAQENILKVKDELFLKLEKATRKVITKAISNAEEIVLPYKSVPTNEDLYIRYSFDVDDEDAIEAKQDLMLMMESEMKPTGFIVANYIDFNKVLKEHKNEDYIFYDAYSLCKLKIIYELSKTKPEAGAFAPCTMVMYHKKGSNKTEIVTLSIANLTSTLAVKDKELLNLLTDAQGTIKSIIEDSAE